MLILLMLLQLKNYVRKSQAVIVGFRYCASAQKDESSCVYFLHLCNIDRLFHCFETWLGVGKRVRPEENFYSNDYKRFLFSDDSRSPALCRVTLEM